MEIKNVALIGMGALGILYGSLLTEKLGRENVCFICDDARMERYEKCTVTANGKTCDFRYARASEGTPCDLVIFAVKSTGLEQAMEDAAAYIGEDTVILSVMNGVTSEALLEERFGGRNVVYCVAQGMDATKDGMALRYTVSGILMIGIPTEHPEKQPALDALCAFFDETGMRYAVDAEIRRRLWSKLMLNDGVNQVVMVEEGTYGTIQKEGPAREMMIAAMRETKAVANLEGVNVTEEDLNGYVQLMYTMSPDGMPSMRQDGLAHRKSEVELFSGTVIRLAEKHGIDVPVNRELYRRVMEMEAKY